MPCRFELEFNDKPYPRSCPDCGVAGKCKRDYQQVRLTPEEGQKHGRTYVLVNKDGNPSHSVGATFAGKGIPASLLIAQGHKDKPQPAIPEHIKFYPKLNAFFNEQTGLDMGPDFWRTWVARKTDFPQFHGDIVEIDPIWRGERPAGKPREHIAHVHATPPRLSRTKRAMIMDLFEDMIERTEKDDDASFNIYIDKILDIICDH